MDNDIKAWRFDILNAIEEIESFFKDRPKKFEQAYVFLNFSI